MHGFDVCKILLALKLHFTSDNYDFFRYGGEVSLTPAGFEIRKDKFFCAKIARKWPIKDKFIDFASTVYAHSDKPHKLWTTNFLSEEVAKVYDASCNWTEAQDYRLEQNLTEIFQKGIDQGHNNVNWSMTPIDGQEPPILEMYRRGEIPLECLTTLDIRMSLFDQWQTLIDDDLMFPILRTRINKFKPFLARRLNQETIWPTITKVTKKYFG